MELALSYDDVLIKPKFSNVLTRAEVELQTKIGNNRLFSLPIISANMDTVTGSEMAKVLGQSDIAACLHRFCTIEENVKMYKASDNKQTFCSVGISTSEYERFEKLFEAGCRNFIVDVAHAASWPTVNMYAQMYDKMKYEDNTIIVGNFATKEEVQQFMTECDELSIKYPSAIKIGVGSGSACQTRIVTGCGIPTLQSLLDIKELGIPMIACGGHKNSGDIAKALAAGAIAVMLGGMLAGTTETPGNKYIQSEYDTNPNQYYELNQEQSTWKYVGARYYKKYRGSASQESYEVQNKVSDFRAPEGISTWVPYKGPVKNVLNEIRGGLKSAFSYVNAKTLIEFQRNAELVRITGAGYKESTPYGK